MSTAVRRRLFTASSPGSLSARTRARRWATLRARFPDLPDMRVLDLGGTARFWAGAADRPVSVVLVNPQPQPPLVDWVEAVVGDACALPDEVTSRSYDLVFSNSVIEHVGGHARRADFARSVRGSAPRYWVQTPYRYFPVEPHYLFPGFQFLPLAARAAVAGTWRLGHRRPSREAAVGNVLDVELLSRTEMRHYFPDAELLDERFGGLTKSLVAVR